jgi:predicted metal-binding protein
MARIGLIRCEHNETRCPLTSCLRSLDAAEQGFAVYDRARLVGVFTCRGDHDALVDMARILKAKGAEAVHLCTCAFAGKQDGAWKEGEGFCADPEAVLRRVAQEAGVPCVLGTAHLPQGYAPKTFAPGSGEVAHG